MKIDLASRAEILQVLRQTYSIWSAGLSASQYQEYLLIQLQHNWSRRNLHFVVCRKQRAIVSSCKLYEIDYASRGKTYRFAGLGAVHTGEQYRGQGFASTLIKELIRRCKKEHYDGLMLFTEIGPEFYLNLDFQSLRSFDFSFAVPDDRPALQAPLDSQARYPLLSQHIPYLQKTYLHWLRRQAFGVQRSELYWDYKLLKEGYLHSFSKLKWPQLEVLFAGDDTRANAQASVSGRDTGYVIFEQGGKTLRILESVGSVDAINDMWHCLLPIIRQRGVERIRGWEANIPQFASQLLINRDWAVPMVYALNKEVKDWVDCSPCPLLELDHF